MPLLERCCCGNGRARSAVRMASETAEQQRYAPWLVGASSTSLSLSGGALGGAAGAAAAGAAAAGAGAAGAGAAGESSRMGVSRPCEGAPLLHGTKGPPADLSRFFTTGVISSSRSLGRRQKGAPFEMITSFAPAAALFCLTCSTIAVPYPRLPMSFGTASNSSSQCPRPGPSQRFGFTLRYTATTTHLPSSIPTSQSYPEKLISRPCSQQKRDCRLPPSTASINVLFRTAAAFDLCSTKREISRARPVWC